jgi:hypothetical protein
MVWREELHPRDARGRWTHKGSMPAVSIKNTLANLHMASEDDLFDVYHRLSSRKQLDAKTLRKIDAELARREGADELPPPEDTPEQVQIDDMVRRGWSYADAYTEAYGLTHKQEAAMKRAEAPGMAERRKGETTQQARRRAYAEVVALQALQAEEATRGNLLAHQCKAIDPTSLWSVAPARARRCASEELKRWWEANGGRLTYREWQARSGDQGARRAARAAAGAGNGRDFGL